MDGPDGTLEISVSQSKPKVRGWFVTKLCTKTTLVWWDDQRDTLPEHCTSSLPELTKATEPTPEQVRKEIVGPLARDIAASAKKRWTLLVTMDGNALPPSKLLVGLDGSLRWRSTLPADQHGVRLAHLAGSVVQVATQEVCSPLSTTKEAATLRLPAPVFGSLRLVSDRSDGLLALSQDDFRRVCIHVEKGGTPLSRCGALDVSISSDDALVAKTDATGADRCWLLRARHSYGRIVAATTDLGSKKALRENEVAFLFDAPTTRILDSRYVPAVVAGATLTLGVLGALLAVRKRRRNPPSRATPGPLPHTPVQRRDVFVSYARSDQDLVAPLVDALRKRCSVWWDTEIYGGDSFRDAIESALSAAKCVVVIWTETSIRSTWVRSEASSGARRGVLVPVALTADELKLPRPFDELHTVRITPRKDSYDEADGMEGLLKSIERHVLPADPPATPPDQSPS